MIIYSGYLPKTFQEIKEESYFTELRYYHPDELLDFLKSVTGSVYTNSDLVINFFRVKHKRKEIDLVIHYYHRSGEIELIKVDFRGELSNYPENFFQHNTNLLLELI